MAKSLMIQGTMSNAGKSLITAGLCRVFNQDGYKPAPFKSQNMALNSFITEEGLEMGRAQVVQAEAAGIAPSVLMNPILLKPTTDTGSQIIVNGKSIGNMKAMEYYKIKKNFIPDIMYAFEALSSKSDIVVIEGAGSPAEINLKENDIVNMGMAKLAKAPVLLAGDIDRGGVFAQLYGTVMLLDEHERKMIKGLIINKFRGDISLLYSGIKMIEDKLGIPVIGTIPYSKIDIEDEDSLSGRFSHKDIKDIDIAVIRLPYISNFTDMNVFERFSGVSLRYVDSAKKFGNPDMVIIPGTKSTISDLLWLRQNGLESVILKANYSGVPIFGICGGFQMLGEIIKDPFKSESAQEEVRGLELFPITTVFEKEKITLQKQGFINKIEGIFSCLSQKPFEGYEIHMGREENGSAAFIYNKNNVYGTYIHGIFDCGDIAYEIVSALYTAKGLKYNEDFLDNDSYKQKQYDLLADIIRENVDMAKVYDIIDKGV